MEVQNKNLRVVIAGAGIGGLTAALTLQRLGFEDVTVLEQASELKEVGAGIQLGPNAVKVLQSLGVGDRLAEVAVQPKARQSRDWRSGRVIRNSPLGDECAQRYGAPYYHVHRADLHRVLVDGVQPSWMRLGAKVTGYEQSETGVQALLASGERVDGDVLIGADGIHSQIRTGVHRGEQNPRFTGLLAWRGTADADKVAHLGIERNANAWWGPQRHFVNYYVSGGRRLNWVAIVPAREWRLESWSTLGDKAELLADLKGWHPTVLGMVNAAEKVYKWALYDRDPWPVWTEGRVTLLGDAAHPMVPFLAQGGGQSVEDGYMLGLCLAALGDRPQAALQAYQALRTERTAKVQLGARAAGEMFHLTNPLKKFMRDLKFWMMSLEAHFQMVDWIYAYDAEQALQAYLAQQGGERKAA